MHDPIRETALKVHKCRKCEREYGSINEAYNCCRDLVKSFYRCDFCKLPYADFKMAFMCCRKERGKE